MRTKIYLIFEVCLAVTLAALIAVFQKGFTTWSIIFKSLASLFFVLAGICGYIKMQKADSTRYPFNNRDGGRIFPKSMMAALLCSMAGDILLALDNTQGILFVLGVISFAAGHILFSIAFCRIVSTEKSDLAKAVIIFCGLLLLLLLGNFNFRGLLPVLIVYSGIISFMTVKALSLWRCRHKEKTAALLSMSGGALFLLSDIVLLFWLFCIEIPIEVQSVNWVLYYLAQGCLSSSLSAWGSYGDT